PVAAKLVMTPKRGGDRIAEKPGTTCAKTRYGMGIGGNQGVRRSGPNVRMTPVHASATSAPRGCRRHVQTDRSARICTVKVRKFGMPGARGSMQKDTDREGGG